MEKNNFEGFYPFIIIILLYLFANLRKRKQNKEREEKRRGVAPPQPVFTSRPSPPVPLEVPIETPIAKRTLKPSIKPPEKLVRESISTQKQKPVTRQPRIKRIVGRLSSRKDLIYISEILTRHDKF